MKGYDGRGFLLDQDVDTQGRNRQVGVLLFSLINAAGAAREDFKDHRGLVLKRVGLRVGPAVNRGIRVIKAGLCRKADTNLGVGVKWPAGPAAQADIQSA